MVAVVGGGAQEHGALGRGKTLVTPGFGTAAAAARGMQMVQRAPPRQWRLDPFRVPRPAVPRGQHVSELLLAVQMACAVQSSVGLQSSHSNFCQGTVGPCTAPFGFRWGGMSESVSGSCGVGSEG